MKIDFRAQNDITTKIPSLKKNTSENTTKSNNTSSNNNGSKLVQQQQPKQRVKRTSRSDEQFRQIFMNTGIISSASGSSYIEIEQTKIICSVHGPRATHKTELFETAKLNCELKYASFSTHDARSDYVESTKEKDYSLIITQAIIGAIRLEKYPKAAIDIYILVLCDAGSALAASIVAASMALADAGVEMYDLVAACSSMPSHNEITQLLQTGELSYTNIVDGIDLCIDGCDKVYSIMKQNLIDSLKRQLLKKEQEQEQLQDS
ncbi:hypothetical protein PPL_11936 [Heterostelium album PN500]|uniref:Exoribonuclease phosphorolytic domain-containing protein n=1 Tax=Heterostelium pallidum (strain ATCC 26659 / Pp 5 / PN500) TaxID=670386 RepID=D3BUW4_HETP5|nr:hypothetical protein PPL_11936 [Heterostelium album PN500]EFA74902.1 hypothetical protein PPL_11936 [Heterostelium album PN500]|eukprot:XP_020427036.1 hypothetical protein PPL_11936 [Heterostelium album PN500]